MRRLLSSLDERIDAVGSLRAVEVLRICAGPLVILHLRPFLDAASAGIVYSDRFWQPYADWYPEVSRHAYLMLLRGCVIAAVLLSIGLLTRAAAVYSAGFVGYNLFLSVTHFHHNRAFLLALLTGLALLPMGRSLSVDALLRARPAAAAPLWPLWLMRFEVVVAYGASGFSKLIDSDWWSGLVTRLRVEQWSEMAAGRGAPEWLLDLLRTDGFHWWFAKAAVATELFIAVGLLLRRTRLAAVWVAVPFHLAVEVTAEVQVFSWAALAALVIWATPAAHDRRLEVPSETVRRLLPLLDWLGRFTVEAGERLVLHDRDAVHEGAAAVRIVLSRLPLTFWVVAPFQLPGLRRVWDRSIGRRLVRATAR
ncbi:MAG TPA: HTTM domain-containing protein [Gemmatimonadales bacterium]|nr:HTTM domain-containing protein [Gemmatimonadales bacterium]